MAPKKDVSLPGLIAQVEELSNTIALLTTRVEKAEAIANEATDYVKSEVATVNVTLQEHKKDLESWRWRLGQVILL